MSVLKLITGGFLMCFLAMAAGTNAAASEKYPELSRFIQRAEKGERLTVAFLGGSITWGATATDPLKTSYRARVGAFLEKKYPKAHFRFIDAAIGGQPSQLGVFRMDRDVLPYKPDLTFVEFSVNDGNRDYAQQTMEGIIRKLKKSSRDMAVVMLNIGTGWKYHLPGSGEKHMDVAKHYGIPYIKIYEAVMNKIEKGLTTKEILTDGCHPNDNGYKLYTDIITRELLKSAKETGTPVEFPKPLGENGYEKAGMLELAKINGLKSWKPAVPSVVGTWFDHTPSRWHSSCVVPARAGAVLETELTCDGIGLYYEIMPSGGKVEILADGKKIMDVDTSQKFQYSRVQYKYVKLDGGKKTRKITLKAEKKDHTKIAYLLYTK